MAKDHIAGLTEDVSAGQVEGMMDAGDFRLSEEQIAAIERGTAVVACRVC